MLVLVRKTLVPSRHIQMTDCGAQMAGAPRFLFRACVDGRQVSHFHDSVLCKLTADLCAASPNTTSAAPKAETSAAKEGAVSFACVCLRGCAFYLPCQYRRCPHPRQCRLLCHCGCTTGKLRRTHLGQIFRCLRLSSRPLATLVGTCTPTPKT